MMSGLARSVASARKRVSSAKNLHVQIQCDFSEHFKTPFFKILFKIYNYVLKLIIVSKDMKYVGIF